MTTEHVKVVRVLQDLIDNWGKLDFSEDEITAIAWAAKNADWLGLRDRDLQDPRLLRILNVIEDVFYNRRPDPTDGATEATSYLKAGEVPKARVGSIVLY